MKNAQDIRRIGLLTVLSLVAGCSTARTQPAPSEAQTTAAHATPVTHDPVTSPPAPQSVEGSAEYHFSLAQAYSSDSDPDRAIEEYKIALMYDPNSSMIYARLATEYAKKGSYALAMEACKEALSRDPQYIDARLMLAGIYATSHEVDQALVEYDRVLKLDPKHEEAMVYKAQLLIEEGHPETATQQLQAFLKRNNEAVLAWYYLAKADQKLERYDEAIRAIKKAIEIRPSFHQAQLSLGYLYEAKKMNEQALEIYSQVYDQTQDVSAANRLAMLLLKQERYAEAIRYLEAVQLSDPEDLNVRVKLGLVYMETKKYDLAIQCFKAILQKTPESDRIHYYLGSLYEETNQMSLAINELKAIKPESKLYGDSILHVAYLLRQEKNLVESREVIKTAIARSPRVATFYLFLASLNDDDNQLDAAIATLEGAIKIIPDDEKLRYYLGSLYDRQGKIDQSLAQMEKILSMNSKNVDALNYVGYTWTMQGVRLNDAERALRKAISLRPGNGYIQDSWGYYLYVRGRTKEAVVELEKAAHLKPGESTILEHLADAYLKQNLREKAFVRYAEAIENTQDDTLRRKLAAKLDVLRGEFAKEGRPLPERLPASVREDSKAAEAKSADKLQ